MTLEERFWAKVDKSDGCWEWSGARVARYGVIRRGSSGSKMVKAHRLSWEIHNGAIPTGMLICHKCDNPPCVRPDHLFVGTPSDNAMDSVRKGRFPVHSHLTMKDIIGLRYAYLLGALQREIAAAMGLTQQGVSGIITGRAWSGTSAKQCTAYANHLAHAGPVCETGV